MPRTTNSTRRIVDLARRASWIFVLAAGMAWVAFASEPEGRKYHQDGKAMEQASLAMSRALILEDMVAARKALDTMFEISPPLIPEAKEVFGGSIYDADRALQQTLTRAREFAALENVARAYDEFVWVQRVCMNCHDHSRKAGRLPAKGPIRSTKP